MAQLLLLVVLIVEAKGPTVGAAVTYKVTVNESEAEETESCLEGGGLRTGLSPSPSFFQWLFTTVPRVKSLVHYRPGSLSWICGKDRDAFL